MLKGGTVVDATIINASPSTKNAEKQRDPEMHQTKKGNEWRFGMKCHIGVDAFSGLVHTTEVTSANVHDVSVATKLIREDDEFVYGDSGYLGIDKREEVVSDEHLSSIDYRINRRPSSLQKVSDDPTLYALHDQYLKRLLHSIALFIAAFTVFIGAELSFYFFGNSKSAELAENMASNLLLIQLPLYLLIKNALGLRFVTRQVCFVDEKRARRHLVGMALFSLLYWLTVLTTTVLLRERLPYPANAFLAAGIVFLLLVIAYDLTLSMTIFTTIRSNGTPPRLSA